MKKISFIVPIYNCENYLMDCVKHLQNQTGAVEIILVDDGSTDRSGELCDRFSKEDNRILVIHKSNEGVSSARNTGLKMATGDWISFVDADDWIIDEFWGEFQVHLDDSIDIGFANSIKITGNERSLYGKNGINCELLEKEDLNLFQRCLFNKYVLKEKPHLTSVWAKVYRNEFLKSFNLLFDTELAKSEDALFNNYAYFYAKKAIWLRKGMYYYRQHQGSVTHKYDEKIVKTYLQHINKLQIFFQTTKLKLEDKNDFRIRVVFDFMYCVVNNFCNKNNPKKYFERKKDFNKSLNIKIFNDAIKFVNIKEFSLKEKVLCLCIRYNKFFLIDLLYKMNTYL